MRPSSGRHPLLPLAPGLLLLLTALAPPPAAAAVGVNWGFSSSHPLPAAQVVRGLLLPNSVPRVRLAAASSDALAALSGTGVAVTVGVPNELLRPLATSRKAAAAWVHDNVTRYASGVRFEVGWPSDGAVNATPAIAQSFMTGLVNHLARKSGTPLRPKLLPTETYLFSLLDEDQRSIASGSYERHFGIFTFDGQAKYHVNLGQGSKALENAPDVQYLPSKWCVLDNNKDISNVSSSFSVACSNADCTALSPGASCSVLPGLGLAERLTNGEGSQQHCWEVLMEIKSCTGEIILFFLNGEAYLGPGCCRSIRIIEQSCWATDAMLSVIGFTPEEGDMLKGYCDAGDDDNNGAGGQPHKPSPPHAAPAMGCVATACESAAAAVPGGRKSVALLHH
ncbi:hypothetical protein E2562_014498 [Oryza meyeriana var. granulata]|uniref:X8 domain-containing protein n=1 Tax=Oryza meyeriana var. granulata TaxID=110450 RepID=A0A6G1CR09_9ORYZ|nr:hypothetical protein E2562_014498 [Oryza meyeriana var. granulata]